MDSNYLGYYRKHIVCIPMDVIRFVVQHKMVKAFELYIFLKCHSSGKVHKDSSLFHSFNNKYKVITRKNGWRSNFTLTTKSEKEPFLIGNEKFTKTIKHGTRLEVIVQKKLPKADSILEVISARFLHLQMTTIFSYLLTFK